MPAGQLWPAGLTKINPTVNAFWQGLGGYYRLGTWDFADAPDKRTPSVTVDTLLGARCTYLDAKIDFKGVFSGFINNVDQHQNGF